jgi:glycosyltransferase involved in cell wall biosynthesis
MTFNMNKHMRILYYSPHPNLNLQSPSGYGTHMREMIQAFRNLGHGVLPVIRGGTEDSESVATGTNLIGHPAKRMAKTMMPAILWESLKDAELLRHDRNSKEILVEAIQSFKPDLIYERASYLQISGVKAAQQNNVPHILEVNAPFVEERSALSSTTLFQSKATGIEKEQLQGATKVAVVSSVLKKYLSEKHKVPDDKFIVTPNAINPDHIHAEAEEVRKIKEVYKLNNFVVIGFVGSIFKWHGVDLLLEAFAGATKARPGTKLLIVGDGDILPDLRQLSEHLNLSGKVVFTGNVPHSQVFSFIQTMDIAVMAKSNWYGSPVKIFEYAAMKKAIVAPDNGPVRDVMTQGEDGILIQPKVSDLMEALQFMIENPRKREEVAVTFHRKVLAQHTWEQTAEKVLNSI